MPEPICTCRGSNLEPCAACQAAGEREFREAMLDEAAARPDRWEECEPGAPDCPHTYRTSIEIDGGDVWAWRCCHGCGRVENQPLRSEPEPPNCYIPGEGWRVI